MNIYEITVTEMKGDFVCYSYSEGGQGMSGKKWFPDVKIGQVWRMECRGALVVGCTRIN
jgi:hypothetical protein